MQYFFQLKRYKTYAYLLRSRVSQWSSDGGNTTIGASVLGELDETENTTEALRPVQLTERNPPSHTPNSRYSYRQAIYTPAPPDSDVP